MTLSPGLYSFGFAFNCQSVENLLRFNEPLNFVLCDLTLTCSGKFLLISDTSHLEAWYLAELMFKYQRTTGIEILSNE